MIRTVLRCECGEDVSREDQIAFKRPKFFAMWACPECGRRAQDVKILEERIPEDSRARPAGRDYFAELAAWSRAPG